jgi:hypothetical protein
VENPQAHTRSNAVVHPRKAPIHRWRLQHVRTIDELIDTTYEWHRTQEWLGDHRDAGINEPVVHQHLRRSLVVVAPRRVKGLSDAGEIVAASKCRPCCSQRRLARRIVDSIERLDQVRRQVIYVRQLTNGLAMPSPLP